MARESTVHSTVERERREESSSRREFEIVETIYIGPFWAFKTSEASWDSYFLSTASYAALRG